MKPHHIIFSILPLMMASCDLIAPKEQHEVRPIKVKVQTMNQQTHAYTHQYVGRIEGASSVALSAQTAGQVTAVYVSLGDHVKTGDRLCSMDDTRARNALQVAQSTLKQAQDGVRRAEQVYAAGGVTEQKMVELRSQLEQARSMVEISRKSLNDCVLRAPTDGVVGECKVKRGQIVAPGLTLITLVDMAGYNVTFDVAEADIAAIAPGDSGSVVINAIGSDTLSICVTEKNLLANTLAHTYTVKAMLTNIPEKYQQQLLPSMVSKVWLKSQSVSGFFVPSECVQTTASGKHLWLVIDGKAQHRDIEIGQYVSGGVVVTQGLQTGDQVVIEGFQKLFNGASIEQINSER